MKNRTTPFSFEDWQNIFSESTNLKDQKKEYRSYLKHFKKNYSGNRYRIIKN